jgi:transposase
LAVQLWVTARRFRCCNSTCPRKIFCERLPNIARVYARQTDRACEIVRLVGYAAGALPGERLLARLAIVVSDDTVLRRLKRPATEGTVPVRNLGVDDWAWRKGQDYGTILVNLDLHRVIDLLPDRSSESFSEWLKNHPEVVTIARDRCGLYAEGATLGAPTAQQIADRFHLLLNLSSAVERVLEERSRDLVLPAVEEVLTAPTEAAASVPVEVATSPSENKTAPSRLQQQRRQRRLERYQQVIELHRQGCSQKAIGQQLGMERKTVRRWLRAGHFPERKAPHRRPPKVSEYGDYLEQRWSEGCHNASRLFLEIREKGYTGKRAMVARFVSGWRITGKPATAKAPERIAPRHAAILVTRPADKMSDDQRQLFERIAGQCPEVIGLRRLALDFRDALKADESSHLRQWIENAKRSPFGQLVRFAYGLQKDISAVTAAVDTPWSSGQVEGQINRLKMIKRQMFGRAGFELLRARVLPLYSQVRVTVGPAP